MPQADFTKHSPGAEEGSVLALTLISNLLNLLVERGVLSRNDVSALLISSANQLSENSDAFSRRGERFIRDAMIPIHPAD